MARHQERTSIKGVLAHSKKYSRTQYKLDFKNAVVEHYRVFGINDTIARFFATEPRDAVRKRVSKWNKSATAIASLASSTQTASHERRRPVGTATVLSHAAEEEIVGWINELRRDGVPVSSKMLQLKALEVAATAGISSDLFAASNSWKASFLRRLSFRTKNRAGQSSPDDDNDMSRVFATEVRDWMKQHGVTTVYNADQTAVFFEMLPKKTISARGEQTVWVKCGKREKQRATAMLLADSDGNKFPSFVVFKTKPSSSEETQTINVASRHGFGRVLWKEVKELQDANDVQIYGNSTAWWNSAMTIEWMRYIFGDRTSTSEPILLLLDSFSGHWTSEVQAYATLCNVQLKCIPPKLTWKCQPADVAWMKPFKDQLRAKWVKHLCAQLSHHQSGAIVMVPPNRSDVASWISQCWLSTAPTTIVSGFAKCGFVQRACTIEASSVVDDMTELVEQLQACGLTDSSVGDVSIAADVVDSMIHL